MDESVQKHLKPIDAAGMALLSVAAEIEEHGWCQGDFQDADGRLCLLGALRCVTNDDARHAAYLRLKKAVGGPLMIWNDTVCRTQDEVVAKVRAAALSG